MAASYPLHPVSMPIGETPPPAQATADLDCALLQKERESDLHKLARALLEHETLDAEDIKAVLSGTFTRVPVGGQEAAGDCGLFYHAASPWSWLEEGDQAADTWLQA